MLVKNDWQSVVDIANDVNSQKHLAVDFVKKALKRVEQYQEYNTVISTLDKQALMKAKALDDKIKKGENGGSLAGVPFIAKDNFLVIGSETTAASNMLKSFRPPYQATAVNLLEAEGAICIAKANMDAFAHGASTENSDFGVTPNPYDKSRVSGGSSGGSAASVALGIAPFALGTDTGGSIRQPASFCGVVGFKPTYGLVSRSGVIAMASSLDCIGPITSKVVDTIEVMKVIAHKDQLDATTVQLKDKFTTKKIELSKLKIGIIGNYISDNVEPDVIKSIDNITTILKDKGVNIETVNIPALELALACYYIICPAEISSNLARYDGIKYGYHDEQSNDLNDFYKLTRGNGFGDEAKRRIMIGTYVLSSGYYDAYYLKAQTVRTRLIEEFKQIFQTYDFLIGPVSPTTAFKIGEKSSNPLQMYMADIMTVASNLLGIPSISIPNGLDSRGLPIGLQLLSPQLTDSRLLSLANSLEELIHASQS